MTYSFLLHPRTKLVFVLILALLIRLAGIASRPIWYDEAFSALLAEQGPSAIIDGTLAKDADTSAAEEHPPAYYIMLWGWMKVFGNTLISLRMLSVLLSVGIIFCIYQIASHLFDPPTALTASFFSTILPFQIHYGQEIRMYVLLTFWLCIATYAFLKRRWILFCIAAALAQYTHNLAAFYLIPLAFTPIFQKDWKTFRSLTLAGFAAIVIYSPWLIQLPAQLSKVTSSFWIEKPGVEKLFTLFLIYLPSLPLPNSLLLRALLFSTLIIALAGFQTYSANKEILQKGSSGLWLAYLSFTPPLFLWLVSQISPIYVERALLPSHAIFCIWLAWAFTKTKIPRPIQVISFVLIILSAAMGFYQHITYKGFPYGPFASLDQSIRTRFMPGDVIIHSNKLTYMPSYYFDRNLAQSFLIDPPGSPTDTLSQVTLEILHISGQKGIGIASANARRVWFIIFKQSLDEFKSQGFQTHPHLDYLNKNFTLTSAVTFDDVRLYLYTQPSN